jgi:two-component system phosphate regulon sensor histidine kinase PhoR
MFYWEGGSLTALVIMGVLLLYRTLRNDIEIRKGHQRFLAGATHELKTPLSSLKLALETLKTGAITPERTNVFYGNMLLEVERLQNQIENLLQAASVHKRADTEKRVNLARLLEEIVQEQRPRFFEKALEIHCEIDGRKTWVQGDQAALRQLLVNLIDNARLYSPKGGKVQLKLQEQKNFISFEISNTGEGIPEEDRERIFERFFRGKDTRETGGSGLGLFLAKQVALDHGGSLLLLPSADRATEERCTTFALRLPKMRSEP